MWDSDVIESEDTVEPSALHFPCVKHEWNSCRPFGIFSVSPQPDSQQVHTLGSSTSMEATLGKHADPTWPGGLEAIGLGFIQRVVG
jgi:hypothetical protein